MRVPAAVVQEMERFNGGEPNGVMVARVKYTLGMLGYEDDEIDGAVGAIFAGCMVMTAITDDALKLGVLRPHEAGAARQLVKEMAEVCALIAWQETPA
jgi:hypothetical protein